MMAKKRNNNNNKKKKKKKKKKKEEEEKYVYTSGTYPSPPNPTEQREALLKDVSG
jgi:hypothetical protein